MLEKLSKDDFAECLNQSFSIEVEGREAVETELVEVKGMVKADDAPDRREPFSLIFEGPMDDVLEQGIFRVENETLGSLDLFMVTIGPGKDRMRHEVVFT
ncbi:MAG: hypothetical protein GY719_08220 [bacterium]|nr:hypothetical protein [bacterium]